jgi:hypothetical protein
MANNIEWAAASYGFALMTPDDLAEVSEEGYDNGADDYGLAMGDGVMVYGTLDDLADLARGILTAVTEEAGR